MVLYCEARRLLDVKIGFMSWWLHMCTAQCQNMTTWSHSLSLQGRITLIAIDSVFILPCIGHKISFQIYFDFAWLTFFKINGHWWFWFCTLLPLPHYSICQRGGEIQEEKYRNKGVIRTQGERVNKNRWCWKACSDALGKQCKIPFQRAERSVWAPIPSSRCLLSSPVCVYFIPIHSEKHSPSDWCRQSRFMTNHSNRLPTNQID